MATVAVTDDTFSAEVLNSDIPVVGDFCAEWCGPCKQIGSALEELSDEMAGKVKVVKVVKVVVRTNPCSHPPVLCRIWYPRMGSSMSIRSRM